MSSLKIKILQHQSRNTLFKNDKEELIYLCHILKTELLNNKSYTDNVFSLFNKVLKDDKYYLIKNRMNDLKNQNKSLPFFDLIKKCFKDQEIIFKNHELIDFHLKNLQNYCIDNIILFDELKTYDFNKIMPPNIIHPYNPKISYKIIMNKNALFGDIVDINDFNKPIHYLRKK